MAFHVACPITCRRICYCSLGFRRDKNDAFSDDIAKLQQFIKDPWLLRACEDATVQVLVPKVVVAPAPVPVTVKEAAVKDVMVKEVAVIDRDAEELVSAQNKRAAMQKKAAVASLVAEDYVRRMEIGDKEGVVKDIGGAEHGVSNVKVMCRLCFNGEHEGSEKARKMLTCKSCDKKYHRSCLKSWAQNRDLFHWSSWTCPSCRTCEVCRRTGDPNKFMFCKRCDGAYHCYCQHPPHKNVSNGPYLCPKHTRCHSCGSNVPGNGLSVRWFLGYTCCDACGRLFVKGNYCPICLKVYRDSEATPMVCCDICQRWVHCQCDDISDERYLQYQVNNNLQYKCATCRGECYQVRDPEDAVQELWKRRDIFDRDLIANLRAAAGLPTQEEIFTISPFSDDEDSGPIAPKNEYGRSVKFSLKGLADNKDEDVHPYRSGERDLYPVPISGGLTEGVCSINQAMKHKHLDEVGASDENKALRVIQLKSNKPQGEDSGKQANKSKSTKGPKLVIHLGARNKNVIGSPRSDASSAQREGSEDARQQRVNDRNKDRHEPVTSVDDGKGDVKDYPDQIEGSKFRGRAPNLIKIKNVNSDVYDKNHSFGGDKMSDGYGSVSPIKKRFLYGKRSTEGSIPTTGIRTQTSAIRGEKLSLLKSAEARVDDESNDGKRHQHSVSLPVPKDSKPLLKLKFKNPFNENSSSWAGEDEKSSVKGQRSKRKRPSPLREKTAMEEEDASNWYKDSSAEEVMEANWILQKLGKDAMGKRVEVHQPSNNSWHKGTVTEVFEDTSTLAVALDDGRAKTLDLEKEGIRFDSRKQRR
ncbi:histone-lysine N-methyltransferase 2D [Heracleum sosnowskyi]|uniref:Histone-lysine N-methyltransferase 2D n=1 Tax=Heracleum sosnowskyi TaxID=360622 RepID=A0AAD8N4C3_9APIA|nr:histone-lysine N-methyltransferase 2D [Heracleum sosnowskyi]